MIKSMTKDESEFLRVHVLPSYYHHLNVYRDSLLIKIFVSAHRPPQPLSADRLPATAHRPSTAFPGFCVRRGCTASASAR